MKTVGDILLEQWESATPEERRGAAIHVSRDQPVVANERRTWVDASRRMPDRPMTCFIYTPHRGILLACAVFSVNARYADSFSCISDGMPYRSGDANPRLQMTHWMELPYPAAPQEAADADE